MSYALQSGFAMMVASPPSIAGVIASEAKQSDFPTCLRSREQRLLRFARNDTQRGRQSRLRLRGFAGG